MRACTPEAASFASAARRAPSSSKSHASSEVSGLRVVANDHVQSARDFDLEKLRHTYTRSRYSAATFVRSRAVSASSITPSANTATP